MLEKFFLSLESFGFIHQDLVLPFGALIVVSCLLLALLIYWRSK